MVRRSTPPITCEEHSQVSIVLCMMNMVSVIVVMRMALDEEFRAGTEKLCLATEMGTSSTTLLWRMRMVPWQMPAKTGIGYTHGAWKGRL